MSADKALCAVLGDVIVELGYARATSLRHPSLEHSTEALLQEVAEFLAAVRSRPRDLGQCREEALQVAAAAVRLVLEGLDHEATA
jgi:hypothetical protein